MNQLIYKNGCWGCKKSQEDPQEQYICPKFRERLENYKQLEYESN